MSWISAAVLSFALLTPPVQDPPGSGDGATGRAVVVTLESGERFEGTVVAETADYLEIRLDEHLVVGFRKSEARSIERRPGPAEPGSPEEVPGLLRERDQWFVLVNGEGWPVGWMHSSVTRDGEQRTRIFEEWEFVEDRRKIGVTMLEVLGRDRQPLSCYYHEWATLAGDDRIRDERILEGEVTDGELTVQRLAAGERSERSYRFSPGTRFPLELSEELRQELGGSPEGDVYRVFDPRSDEFVMRNLGVGRWRDIQVDGEAQRVREMVAETAGGSNAEWLDASAAVVRREINGPALVAIPTTEDSARRQAMMHEQLFPSARRMEPDNRFAFWLPNPLWQFEEESISSGQIVASSKLHGAEVTLALLDYLDKDLLIDSVADAVIKLHRLVSSDFQLRVRGPARVREREAVRLEAEFREGELDYRSVVYVLALRDGHAMLSFKAPAARFAELEPDFERILGALELDAAEVAPEVPDLIRRRDGDQTTGR